MAWLSACCELILARMCVPRRVGQEPFSQMKNKEQSTWHIHYNKGQCYFSRNPLLTPTRMPHNRVRAYGGVGDWVRLSVKVLENRLDSCFR